MKEHVEELREMTMAEVGAPRMLTAAAQLEGGPVEDLSFSADTAESYSWRHDLGIAAPMGIKTQRTIVREAVGVVGAITPWNFPHQINSPSSARRWRRATPSCSSPPPLIPPRGVQRFSVS